MRNLLSTSVLRAKFNFPKSDLNIFRDLKYKEEKKIKENPKKSLNKKQNKIIKTHFNSHVENEASENEILRKIINKHKQKQLKNEQCSLIAIENCFREAFDFI